MARSYVFLVHGVGQQEIGSDGEAEWAKPWKAVLLEELRRYAPYADMTPEAIEEEHICFWPVSYDTVFEDRFRKVWGNPAGALASTAVPLPPAAREAVQWVRDNESAEDAVAFFWNNALDALLWFAFDLAHAAVKAHVAPQLARGIRAMVQENGGDASRAHIVAHSLGTAVIHDTLVSLVFEPDLHEGVLDPSRFKWQSIAMVANTSRLLESAVDVSPGARSVDFEAYRSLLRPDRPDACCRSYLNVRHRLDPITWPRRFDPPWPPGRYREVLLEGFSAPKKVHDFDHYVRAPEFHVRLFRAVVGNLTLGTADEVAAARTAHQKAHPHSATDVFDHLHDLAANVDRDITRIAEYLIRAYEALS